MGSNVGSLKPSPSEDPLPSPFKIGSKISASEDPLPSKTSPSKPITEVKIQNSKENQNQEKNQTTPRTTSTTTTTTITITPKPEPKETQSPKPKDQDENPNPKEKNTTTQTPVTPKTTQGKPTQSDLPIKSEPPPKSFVVRKCTKRYEKRVPPDEDKERYLGDISLSVVNPTWLSQQIFDDNESTLVIKLLLIPVAPSAFASIIKITGSDYGYLHTGIQINKRVIDWDMSGLIVPRAFSKNVFAALDIASAGTESLPKTPEMVEKVTRFIAKWNSSFEYSMFSRNCQHFVNELLDEMNIKIQWSDSIASYIHDIKNNPKNISPHIEYKLDGKTIKKEFKTHEELDLFSLEMRKNDPDQYMEIKPLLKAFDRGFWFRDSVNQTITYDLSNCPYGTPTTYQAVEFDKSLL